jgi:hypothetical protein
VLLAALAILFVHSIACATPFIPAGLRNAEILPGAPLIDSATFSGATGDYTVTFTGSGFGSAPISLPYTGDLPNFRIGDSAPLAESGYTGDAYFLTFTEWTDTSVTVSGFSGWPGDAVTVAIWNQRSHLAATWGGTVPPPDSTIRITSVKLTGTGEKLRIEVRGSGFGPSPSELPQEGGVGDLNYFRFFDFRSHCGQLSSLFEAGFEGWGRNVPTNVTLRYESWSDTRIVTSGFSGAYGQGCATYKEGDPVAIVVWNSGSTDSAGAQTAWGGRSRAWTTSAAEPATEPTVMADSDCLGSDREGVRNNTHGTVEIVSGAGAFDTINSEQKKITVSPGAALQGAVTLRVLNLGPGFAVALMVETPSWGDHAASWRLLGNLPTGEVTRMANIDLHAPLQPGIYHILFAFQLELSGGNVASGTNWSTRGDVWNDGNDLAEFSPLQIRNAQSWGCAIDPWLMPEGPQLFYVPADAITVEVK